MPEPGADSPHSAKAVCTGEGEQTRATFNKAQRIWRSDPDYFDSPWDYYVRFIEILKSRGAKFITFSDALAGEYDPKDINVLLDHHIDFYVIETEVMCRWELDHDVRSNVYLFNRYSPREGLMQKHDWCITDLNVSFYQQLERCGFEIGYHQNAVGQVLIELNEPLSWRKTKVLSPGIVERAQQIFARDVSSLAEHFDIRTFIPHGAGENNAQLLVLPDGYEQRVTWVYNNAKRGGTVEQPLRFRNYSESCGQRAQRFRDGDANWINHIDNLHVHARLIGKGLNHILIHAGRFGRGMPYETYDWTSIDESETVVDYEFEQPVDRSQLPWPPNRVFAGWIGAHKSPPRPPSHILAAPRRDKYRLLTNNASVLEDHLSRNDRCIATLLVEDVFRGRLSVKHKQRPRLRVSDPSPLQDGDAPTSERFQSDFLCFYNLLYAPRPIEYLAGSSLMPDDVQIHEHRIRGEAELAAVSNLLSRYGRRCEIMLQLEIPAELIGAWCRWRRELRRCPEIADNFRFHASSALTPLLARRLKLLDPEATAIRALITNRTGECSWFGPLNAWRRRRSVNSVRTWLRRSSMPPQVLPDYQSDG